MSSFTRRAALAGGTALVSTAALAACGNGEDADTSEAIASPDGNVITDTSDPKIVKEKTTVTFMSRRPPTTAKDWDEVGCFKIAEKTTNLSVDFGLVPDESVGEKVNLALASGEYPEAFYRTNIEAGDIAKYAGQGTFIALDELIDTYMPNLKKLLDGDDSLRAGITMPDGHIYSMPQVYDKNSVGLLNDFSLWVRKDWADRLGMDIPTTLDEYEAYLDECVHGDPRGDGKKGIVGASGPGIWALKNPLAGTFGIYNHGVDAGPYDEDPDNPGKVRLWGISDDFREMLTYFNRLYTNGLIQQDIFSTDAQKSEALASEGVVASSWNISPDANFGDQGSAYEPLLPLKKDAGSDAATWNPVHPPMMGIGQFILTDKCTHPVEIARWADFWYGEEGAKAFFMGVEGESYKKKGDGYELLDTVTKSDKSFDEAMSPYAMYLGGGYPAWATDDWFKGVETSERSLAAAEQIAEYDVEDVWAPFTFTTEESDILTSTGQDIAKAMDEAEAAFITGKRKLTEWDDYVDQVKSMGLDEYTKCYQSALDRRQ
jgi:putative aldouronate transport system substrate-binding protein